jgi:hypothetical protein
MAAKGTGALNFLSKRDLWGWRFRALPVPVRISIEYGFTLGLAVVASLLDRLEFGQMT